MLLTFVSGMLQLGDAEKATFYDIQSHLEDTYCGNISFEVSHMTVGFIFSCGISPTQ